MLINRLWHNLTVRLMILFFLVAFLGLIIQLASSQNSIGTGIVNPFLQGSFITVCLIGIYFISKVNLNFWFHLAGLIYWIAILGLILVELVGVSIYGGKRWINYFGLSVQPAEFFKVAYIIAISRYFYLQFIQSKKGPWVIFKTLVWLSPALYLIYEKQSDLGTTLSVLSIWLVALIISNLKTKWLMIFISILLLLSPIMWNNLEPYQKRRIEVFINPNLDKLNTGYNVNQAKIAIAGGKLFGQGLQSGTQSQLNFLPSQHTDFIFAVLAEKLGLIGCLFLLTLYYFILKTILDIAKLARNNFFACSFCLLFGTLLMFHIVENIGMNLGLLPVAGIPLPLISLGGSNMLAMAWGIGIVSGIYQKYRFA